MTEQPLHEGEDEYEEQDASYPDSPDGNENDDGNDPDDANGEDEE